MEEQKHDYVNCPNTIVVSNIRKEMKENHEELLGYVRNIDVSLRGNGHPGLKAQVSGIKTKLNWMWAIGGACITAGAGSIFYILIALI